jgi:hypothetical protein
MSNENHLLGGEIQRYKQEFLMLSPFAMVSADICNPWDRGKSIYDLLHYSREIRLQSNIWTHPLWAGDFLKDRQTGENIERDSAQISFLLNFRCLKRTYLRTSILLARTLQSPDHQ